MRTTCNAATTPHSLKEAQNPQARPGTRLAAHVAVLFETLPVQLHFLPEDVRVEDVMRRTRHAVHAFLGSAANGWGKTKLRSWLIVEYGMATEWTREDEVSPWLQPVARMADEQVREVVEDARRRMGRLLVDESSGWSTPGFAKEMIDRGLITGVIDSSGREACAPAARVQLSFLERVASLFIADYLAHPASFAHMTSCESCGEVQLYGRVTHARACMRLSSVRPPAESGVRLRDSSATVAAPASALPPAPPPRLATVTALRRSG